jgi:hypothetical protein
VYRTQHIGYVLSGVCASASPTSDSERLLTQGEAHPLSLVISFLPRPRFAIVNCFHNVDRITTAAQNISVVAIEAPLYDLTIQRTPNLVSEVVRNPYLAIVNLMHSSRDVALFLTFDYLLAISKLAHGFHPYQFSASS